MGKVTEDELDMLSPEEREAIEEDAAATKSTDEIRAEEEALADSKAVEDGGGIAKRSVDNKSAEKTQEELDGIAAEEKLKEDAEAELIAAEQAVKDAEALEVEGAVAEKALPTPSPIEPAFVLESELKFGSKEEIDAKMAELDTKFEDGDVTLAAYNKERAEYVEALTEMKMFDKINAQVHKAAAEKGWKDSQNAFFKEYPEYSSNRVRNVAFVDAVNRLLATDESKRMTDAEVFDAAKQECDAEFYPNGRMKAGSAQADNVVSLEDKRKAAEDVKLKAIEAARKLEATKAAAVKTLAQVPVSEGNAGEDKFDVIDKLTGEAYENAVAKMSNAERQAYAARG